MNDDIRVKVVVETVGQGNDSEITNIKFPSANCNPIGDYTVVNALSNLADIGVKSTLAIDGIKSKKGDTPFIIGSSILGGGDSFYTEGKKYPGFISSDFSARADTVEPGKVECVIEITGRNIDFLVVEFDAVARQWATVISVNDRKHYNTGARFIWTGTPSNKIILKVLEWNMPGYPVRITRISNRLTIAWSDECIEELTRGHQCTADNTKIEFGLIGQYGSITVRDIDGDLMELAQNKVLKKNMPIAIYMGDKSIGAYIADEWKYDFNTKKLKVQLVDAFTSQLENTVTDVKMNEYVLLSSILDKILLDFNINKDLTFYGIDQKEYNRIALYAYYSDYQTAADLINNILKFLGVNGYFNYSDNSFELIEI